jgi:hypothetical protein
MGRVEGREGRPTPERDLEVGVSGGTPDEDHEVAEAGVAAFG